MAQFTVYKNSGKNKSIYPFFIDVQSDLLSHLSTRIVMPIALKTSENSQINQVTPAFLIKGREYVVISQMVTTVSANMLKEEAIVVQAEYLRNKIVSAVDLLFTGI
ncbi:CcdB family protein [Leminorella grimontii]|uniref:CcdB family protein n=1 Tax=Leminorella grimontii TaxID=82981 RepID=UPI00322036BC